MNPDRIIELIQSVAACVALGRLINLRLAKRFSALFAWLGLLAVTHLLAATLSRNSALYFWFYIGVVPADCVFGLIAVRELFSLVFIDYPGIRSVGRWSMYAGIVIATAASAVVAGAFSTERARTAVCHLFYLESSQRSIGFSLAIVIATILFFLSRYPLHLGRNTYGSSAFFSALFLGDAARLLIDSMQSQLNSVAVDWGESFFVVACLIGWAMMLKPETAPKPARITFSSPEEDHLLEQLSSLNDMLGRTVRR